MPALWSGAPAGAEELDPQEAMPLAGVGWTVAEVGCRQAGLSETLCGRKAKYGQDSGGGRRGAEAGDRTEGVGDASSTPVTPTSFA